MKRDPSRGFEGLEVYRISEHVSDALWDIVRGWDYFARDTVGKQLVRAADSIGANIAEGKGRDTGPDNRRFAFMARGSLNETRHFLRRAYKRELLSKRQIETLTPLVERLSPMLNAYIRAMPAGRRRVASAPPRTTNTKQRTTRPA